MIDKWYDKSIIYEDEIVGYYVLITIIIRILTEHVTDKMSYSIMTELHLIEIPHGMSCDLRSNIPLQRRMNGSGTDNRVSSTVVTPRSLLMSWKKRKNKIS